MTHRTNLVFSAGLLLGLSACAIAPAPTPAPAANTQARAASGGQDTARAGGAGAAQGPRPYRQVITDRTVTQDGIFRVHRIAERLLFEIPASELGREMLLISRPVESTLQNPAGFFGGGMREIVQWERDGNRVILRAKEHDLAADTTSPIWRQVRGFRKGPVLATYNVAAYGPDSAAVIDVSDLFLSNIPEMGPVDGIVRNRSWIEHTMAFPDNLNIEVTQSGQSRPPATGGGGGGPGGGGGGQPPLRSQTVRLQFSMLRLPDEPMMPRWHDERVGFNSSRTYDMSREVHKSEQMRFIHRFKLVKKDPNAAVSDPVEPIIYWIDPATPDWLKPWVVVGVEQMAGRVPRGGLQQCDLRAHRAHARRRPRLLALRRASLGDLLASEHGRERDRRPDRRSAHRGRS